jgi:hypothetical protein
MSVRLNPTGLVMFAPAQGCGAEGVDKDAHPLRFGLPRPPRGGYFQESSAFLWSESGVSSISSRRMPLGSMIFESRALVGPLR